jgi:thiol-disulfide isomerase/thioredoxin
LASPRPWQTVALTDVRTGAMFRLQDFAGKVVLVESMATWCPPCREQQLQAQLALRRLEAGSVVYVSLDVDPRESRDTLRAYADRNRFAWTFAVGTPELLRLMSDDLGDVVLDPPATPIVVVGTDGSVTLAELGIKSSDRLVALVQAHGA